MIKIGVVGAAGRMGRTIAACIEDTDGVELCCGTEATGNPALGQDVGELAGIGKKNIVLHDDLAEMMRTCDVVIDFSTPESSMRTLKEAVAQKKSVIF